LRFTQPTPRSSLPLSGMMTSVPNVLLARLGRRYGATIRDRGTGSTRVRAGRPLNHGP
jgi:hypothetical protein